MKLSDFIRTHIDAILDAWEEFARGIPTATGFDPTALRDHARGMLAAIADDLDTPQTPHEQAEKSKGRAPLRAFTTEATLHGAARVAEGFSVNDAMAEFRALRASVLRLWTDTGAPHDTSGELMRFNEAIDEALTESLARYASDKDRQTRLFDTLLSSSPDLRYIFDLDASLIYANKALAGLYGQRVGEMAGKRLSDLCPHAAAELDGHLRHVIDTKQTHCGEMPYRRAASADVTYEYLFVPVIDQAGKVEAVAGTARDITKRKASEQRIRRSANYDSLTDLPNRSLFRDRLAQEIKRAARTSLPLALLFIDLDGFKEVNDRLGHAAGDVLLQQAARRIAACVRGVDTVARLGGDEFTVILSEVRKTAHVDILAQQILAALARPFSIAQTEVAISGSIGITLFPQDAATPGELVRNADQAMYVAKNAGRNRFSFFTARMRDLAWARLKVIDELRHALPLRQLCVHFQPIVALPTGRIVKAEAQLRWHHPQTGLLRPGEFIGLAEETGLIGEIDEWVLGEALARARQWSALLGMPFQISINKSAVELTSKTPMKNWDAHVDELCQAWHSISVEVTEAVLLGDSPSVREKLDHLHRAGVQLAIGDFGTGYAAIAYLRKFDIDYLKIGQSFVHGVANDKDRQIFTETIILMAHQLGLAVIAEGVETLAQKDWLSAAGCDYAQGYLFSPPVTAEEFEKLLIGERARAAAPPP